MKVCLSENGHSKEFKPLEELEVSFGKMDNTPLGANYHHLGFESNEKISKLLDKFDESNELELYFFKNILYIIIESEPVFYIVEMDDEDLIDFCEQIKKDKKLIIATYTNRNKIENLFLYDIIM